MPGLLEQSGAPPQKQPKYVPVFVDRHFTGLYTQRNPLHDPSDVITAKYYGGRPDALWMGNNVELTNRLTLQRRPGLTAFSSAVYPTAPDNTFSFQLSDGTIRVIVDTGTTGLLPLTSVANASNGTTVYTGTFPIGGSSSISVPIVNTTTIAPPAAPTISGSTGTLNFGTAFVKVTYLNAAGETLASAESSTLVSYHPAGHNPTNPTVTVNSPISVPGVTSYNVYISMSTGTETLQNSVPVPLGSQYSLNLFNLVSGAPVPGSNTTTTAPPASASLSSVAGGSLAGTTYFVKITYVTAAGETTGSVESSLAVAANHLLVVSSPTTSPGVTGYNVYVSTTTNTELLQTAPPIAIGTNWTEPFAGLAGPSSATYTGMVFSISGFVNGQNNGTFLCVGSTGTTLTLANTAGVVETRNATAISSGAVYWDQQQNGLKTLLFGKSPGAGQTLFQAVAGILYAGDGIDTWKYTPLNPNLPPGSAVSVWNWGIVAPTQQPSVSIVASGAASTVWQANTIFSTMGLTVDMFGQAWQLIGVDADGSNTSGAVFGTAGNGQPAWNQALFGTTTEASGTPIVWKNVGQLLPWQANFFYGVSHLAGVAGLTAIVDLASDSIYCNFTGHGGLTQSGTVKPPFNGVAGSIFHDNQCVWFFVGKFSQFRAWQPSTAYNNWVGTGTTSTGFAGIPTNCAIEPFILPPPPNQPVYLQVPTNTGTSGTPTQPFLANSGAGTQQPDGQLLWLSLGSATWQPSTSYIQWQVQGTPFGCVDDGVNMQVCVVSGTTDVIKPGTVNSTLTAVANAVGGNTAYTGTFSPTLSVGRTVVISGFTNPANNGTFSVVSCTSTILTVNNAGGVAESNPGSLVYNPWGISYGRTTQDGSVTWVCVGPQVTWVAGSSTTGIWNLPLTGFQPPQTSQAYGGSTVNSNTALVETVISSGKSGASTPTWSPLHGYTADGGSPLTLTSVAVSGGIATYNGTITGGAGNAFAGFAFVISGFTNPANNGVIYVTSSTATTLVCSQTGQVNETHAATATTGLIWFAESAVTVNSLSWSFGLAYAYSFKARAFDDFYSPAPIGGGNISPGSTFGALGPPTGSATEAVSTASPAFSIVGANAGAVNTISGFGSTDPQVDTIIIWRSADSAVGASQMFELTEIPAPKPINGVAQPWSFQDFLPSTPTSKYPGLNTLAPAPINEVNNPPLSNYLPMAYNFQRIWGAAGQVVPFSGGPDTAVGNPNEAFAPADNLPFLAPVIRLVKTPQGLVTFTPDSVEIIAGGPQTVSFFSVTWAPGIGLMSYNMLDVLAGEIYFFSSDNQFRIMTPSLNISNAGFPLGDQFANTPSSGLSDTTWNPATGYVASHQNGTDNCIIVSDGLTGWYRLNPRQVGAYQSTEPVWSPFAIITNGCKLVQSVQVSPGIKKLLVGPSTPGQQILERNLSVFTDNGFQYDAFFIMGSIMLTHPGQLALLKFMEFDFSGVSYQPTISYLLNEVSGVFTAFTAAPQFDPPSLYGKTLTPGSYSPNRYYFLGNGSLARCRHLQVRVDFGVTPNGDEVFNATIFGRIMIET